MNIGLYSYIGASIAYAVFTVLMLFSWRSSLQGKLLFVAMLVSTLWAMTAVRISLHDESFFLMYRCGEVLRYVAWYVFLFKLFDAAGSEPGVVAGYRRFTKIALPASLLFAALLIINEVVASIDLFSGQTELSYTGNLVLALFGVAILEQVFRNMSSQYRWSMKYLFLGAGGIFIYDFYLYADALLFRTIDKDIWDARGFVHVIAVPLLAVASARIKNWSLNLFVSRDVVFTTTAIMVGGVYLLAMAIGGYYLREYGGSWGSVVQVMFVVLAIVFLFAVMTSSQLKARVKVFLGKHFYKNKYDYRIEWLSLTDSLNEADPAKGSYQQSIESMAKIVEAKAGMLWMKDDKGAVINLDSWHCRHIEDELEANSSLISFLEQTGYVINLHELGSHADEYTGLELPTWLVAHEEAWLVVPLLSTGELVGFIVLASPLVQRPINWEDRDLLKAAAKQVTSHLIVLKTSAQLAEAKQFEVFSRLSAFMVHDLKNIAAELALVSRNAKKHIANPAFLEDAFDTVENASRDINRLLEQLRNKRMEDEKKVRVDLLPLVQEVTASRQHELPAPRFVAQVEHAFAVLQRDRLKNVIIHLVENAQQATEDSGEIMVSVSRDGHMYRIEIRDTGHGMDEAFVRERLFKPFDTTKGNAGMGIGMFESREFIRQLGGDVLVESRPGKGTVITLKIPAEQAVSE